MIQDISTKNKLISSSKLKGYKKQYLKHQSHKTVIQQLKLHLEENTGVEIQLIYTALFHL